MSYQCTGEIWNSLIEPERRLQWTTKEYFTCEEKPLFSCQPHQGASPAGWHIYIKNHDKDLFTRITAQGLPQDANNLSITKELKGQVTTLKDLFPKTCRVLQDLHQHTTSSLQHDGGKYVMDMYDCQWNQQSISQYLLIIKYPRS